MKTRYFKSIYKFSVNGESSIKGDYGLIEYDGQHAYLLHRIDAKTFKQNHRPLDEHLDWSGWKDSEAMELVEISEKEKESIMFLEAI